MIAVGLSLLLASPARAGVTISNFRDGPDGAMEGTVSASGYGPCSGTDTDGCFATYLHGYIRADDGACPPGDGNPAVAAVLPRDGSPVTEAVDGDPVVRGWNRLCAYVERIYWSGATAVIAQGSATAYSNGPVRDGDQRDCSDVRARTSVVGDWPSDRADLGAAGDDVVCEERDAGQRAVPRPGGLPRAKGDLRLSTADARRQINRVLRRVFKRSFIRRGLRRRCKRRTQAKIACRVAWRGPHATRFNGRVAVRKLAVRRYRYTLRVHKVKRTGQARLVKRSGLL